MITLSSFNALHNDDQDSAIGKDGVKIAHRETKKFHVNLFQLWYFYVEVFTDKIDGAHIRNLGFINLKRFHPYLKQIAVPIIK